MIIINVLILTRLISGGFAVFWLPICLSLILICGHILFRRTLAISFDVFILLNTLEDTLWQAAPAKIQRLITRSRRDLQRLRGLALVSCVGLMLVSFLIIASYRAEPGRSSIIIVLCAIDTYGFYFLFQRLFIKVYAWHRYPKLKTAIDYLIHVVHQKNQEG